MMQVTEQIHHLDAETARAFLEKLPRHIREAFYSRAAAIEYPIIEYPIEAVLESVIAASLDPDALSFIDCKPGASD